jgi:hypothetical protein
VTIPKNKHWQYLFLLAIPIGNWQSGNFRNAANSKGANSKKMGNPFGSQTIEKAIEQIVEINWIKK